MKIMVLGTDKAIVRLTGLLSEEKHEVIGLPEGLEKMEALASQMRLDLVILDARLGGVREYCRHLDELAVPIVILADQRQVDWRNLQLLNACGYLPEEAANSELTARLRAIIRRLLSIRAPEDVQFRTNRLQV